MPHLFLSQIQDISSRLTKVEELEDYIRGQYESGGVRRYYIFEGIIFAGLHQLFCINFKFSKIVIIPKICKSGQYLKRSKNFIPRFQFPNVNSPFFVHLYTKINNFCLFLHYIYNTFEIPSSAPFYFFLLTAVGAWNWEHDKNNSSVGGISLSII